MSEFSDRIRKEFGQGDSIRDAGLTTPDGIARYDDISYSSDPKYHLLDVYRPKDLEGKVLPVIAIVHGGAWIYGDKGVYQHYAMGLAGRGFAVVNFSYRLAPEHKFPAHIEDICAAFCWINENHEKYGLDLDNVFAVGDSAGAHLLGLFSALYTNPAYLKALKEKYPEADFTLPEGEAAAAGNDVKRPVNLRAVALNCGKYDLSKGNVSDPDTPRVLADLFADGGSDAELALSNVTAYVTGAFPRVFLMTCPGDFLKYQAPFMVDAMMEAGVPFVFRYYGDTNDPLHHVFHCNMRLESAKECNDDECGFFLSLCDFD